MGKDTIGAEIGYSCSYVPLEILDSFGIKPTYCIGNSSSADVSQSYLSTNICGFVKDVISRPKDEIFDMVFTDCCDAMVKIQEAFALHPDFENDYSFLLTVPRSFDELEIDFWPNVLRHFIEKLEESTDKKFSEENLAKSIKKYNRLRRSLKQVEEMLLENKLWGSEYVDLLFNIYDAGIDKAIDLTDSFLETNRGGEEKDVDWGILVAGSNFPAAQEFARHLEEYDGNARYFDTCNLARFYSMDVSEDIAPIEAISKAYLTKPPCPRMKNSIVRLKELVNMIKEYELDGAVYHTLKFCATNIYDYLAFKKLCEKEGIPFIRLETDHDFELPGQMQTRLEAFLEML